VDRNKMMLGFIVRRCAVELRHSPSPAELAEWANNQATAEGRFHLFGKPISAEEASVILGNPGRLVRVRKSSWNQQNVSQDPFVLSQKNRSVCSQVEPLNSSSKRKIIRLRIE
jgi:hypothetical protein